MATFTDTENVAISFTDVDNVSVSFADKSNVATAFTDLVLPTPSVWCDNSAWCNSGWWCGELSGGFTNYEGVVVTFTDLITTQ